MALIPENVIVDFDGFCQHCPNPKLKSTKDFKIDPSTGDEMTEWHVTCKHIKDCRRMWDTAYEIGYSFGKADREEATDN